MFNKKIFLLIISLFLQIIVSCGHPNDLEANPKNPKYSMKGDKGENSKLNINEKCTLSVKWLENSFVGWSSSSNKLELNFKDQNNDNIDIAIKDFKFWIYMKIHGHGGSGKIEIKKLATGRFLVSGFYFTMEGPWELMVKIKIDNKDYTLEFPVEL